MGVRRFEAAAKNSSEQARTVAFREVEARFVVVEEKTASISAAVGSGVIFPSVLEGLLLVGISIFMFTSLIVVVGLKPWTD